MRDFCRCELGGEGIGALSFLWGRTAVANDVEAKFEVGLQELSNQARCVLSEPCTEFDFGYVEL
jgi:hypothetical protein